MATILITSNALFRISNSFPYPSHSHKPSKITFTSTLRYSHWRNTAGGVERREEVAGLRRNSLKAKQSVQDVWETKKEPTQKINEMVIGDDDHLTTKYSLLQSCNENMDRVALDSMLKANSIVEDFCRSYFMFHGLDVSNAQVIFKYLPILSFTESYIYQLDNLNEKLLQKQNNEKSLFGVKDEREIQLLVSYFSNSPTRPLMTILERKGLLTKRITEELKHGEEYWALERKLCDAVTNKKKILVEDVIKTTVLRSFDYQVLGLLLYQLRGVEVDELHMEFLSISDFLMDICDDLYDYEEDVLDNTFNCLRFFVKIYGASSAPAMLAKCISEAEDKFNSLLKSLDPQLAERYLKRCAETNEDGKLSRHPLGTWSIPTVIEDEELYRSKFKSN